MRVKNNNIVMRDGDTVDGRDVSVDGSKLDAATPDASSNTLVMRDGSGRADMIATRADRITLARTISLAGFVSGSISFDGTTDVSIDTTYTGTHEHHDLYYTEGEIDQKLADLDSAKTDVGHAHHLFTSGEGVVSLTYDGTANAQVNLDWAGTGGDFGIEKSPARSDHLHNATNYTKQESDDAYVSTLEASGDALRTVDALGNVHDVVQAPWALRLGPALGQAGIPLMSQNVNNEPNRVMRTNANGHVLLEGVHVETDSLASADITDVFVTDSAGYVKKCDTSVLRDSIGLTTLDADYLGGLPKNSTTLNNESNTIVRTNNDGDVLFETVNLATTEITTEIVDVYVGTGDGDVQKCTTASLKTTMDLDDVVKTTDVTDVVRTADMANVVYDSDISDVVRDADMTTVARTDGNNTWTKGNRGAAVPLSGSAPSIDLDASNNFDVSLDGPCALSFINLDEAVGQSGAVSLLQDASGGHSVTFSANVVWAGGTPGEVTLDPDSSDILTYYVLSPTKVFCSITNDVK